jgi:hypothetical protein
MANNAELFLPAYTGIGGPYADVVLPAYSLEATSSWVYNTVEVVVPLFTGEAHGFSGNVGSIDGSLPVWTLEAGTPPAAELTIPAYTLEATALGGALGDVDGTLPAYIVEGAASANNIGTADFALPVLRLSAIAFNGGLASMDSEQPGWQLVATGFSGSVSRAELVLPAITLDFSGYGPYVGTAEVVLPSWVLEASAVSAVAAALRTWVLNLSKRGLTEYDGFAFNSYANFRNTILAASAGGLFTHAGQDSDAGGLINALVRTGEESFGTSFNKRVPRIYVGYKTDGAMKFSTITSQDGQRVYLLPDNKIRGVQQRRVPVGRGPKSPYWQFEMTNVEGADFLIEHLHVYPEKSNRRVV